MKHQLVNCLVMVGIAAVAGPSAAQYKWQSSDGVTVYSDVPPPGGAERLNERRPALQSSEIESSPAVALPFALKQVTAKLPVVLFTASECTPCQTARTHLQTRGIPFSEKTIATSADFDKFKSFGFNDNGFPAMTVGRDKTVGFEPGAWDRLLDSAGYPKTSQLPTGYKQAAAEPLTEPVAQRTDVIVEGGQAAGTGALAGAAAAPQRAIDRYRASLEAARRENSDRVSGEKSLRF